MCAVKFEFNFVCFIVLSIHISSGQLISLLDYFRSHGNAVHGNGLDEAIDPPNYDDVLPNEVNYPDVHDELCASYNPPVPDFSTPGRRISEIKCFEYNWQLKIRAEKAKRLKQCKFQQVVNKQRSKRITRRQAPLYINKRYPDVHVDTAKRGEYPNMGAIGWKTINDTWTFLCGCSLISSKFVLTAAHCSKASKDSPTLADVEPKIVRLGSTVLGITVIDANIINVIVHPNYKSPKKYFDIALMELAREVVFSEELQPACLWTKYDMDFNHVEIIGWSQETGSLSTSAKLQVADVDIVNSSNCDGLLKSSCNRNWCGLKEHQMCAGKLTGGVDTCEGDSGGPLQVNIPLFKSEGAVKSINYVVGVTAFGVRCGLPQLPGVYTRVASFIDWIESIVWPAYK